MAAAERFNDGDLDGLMAYWAEDAIFYMFGMPPTGSEIARGKEQIRAVFEENIASHSRWEIEIGTVVGDTVSSRSRNWHDFTRRLGVAPLEATAVFQIRDGKIATHAWTVTADSAVRLKSALANATTQEAGTAAAGTAATAAPEAPAATAAASSLTVTISDGLCQYAGPLVLQGGEITVTLDVRDQDKDKYALTFFTLEPGKDFMDLMASTTQSSPPAWSDMFSHSEVDPGRSETYRMSVVAGPVYGICWSKPPDLPIGNVGPLEVSQQ